MDFPATLQSKLPHLQTTIFAKMSALAAQHGAINLSQGFPDFDPDPALIDLVYKHMRSGKNQYAPLAGVPELREAISNRLREAYGVSYDVEKEITVTAGATQAIHAAISATVRENDEVIIFTPAYDCYAPLVELNGGKPVYVQLHYPDYKVDWDQVKKLINHRTRMIVINSPHNPTGSVLEREDMEKLTKITGNSNILILSDEVYEYITFDGRQHQSVTAYPELAERSFAIFSFGKTYHCTGWKLGYCVAPESMSREMRKVHQYDVFCANTPLQHAFAEYMTWQKVEIAPFFQSRRDLFAQFMSETAFKPIPSYGTYFQLYDYSAISEEGDEEFAERLTREYGVAGIPVSVFYHAKTDHKVLRFCFAKDEATLKLAAEKLKHIS